MTTRSGPRYLEPGREGDVAPTTLAQYRAACGRFLEYLESNGFVPVEVEEWDDLLVELSLMPNVSLSAFRVT